MKGSAEVLLCIICWKNSQRDDTHGNTFVTQKSHEGKSAKKAACGVESGGD